MLNWIRHHLTPVDDTPPAGTGIIEAREARKVIDSTVAAFQQEAADDMQRQALSQRSLRDEFIIGELFPLGRSRRDQT
jgi:hypothetical protein